MTQLFWYKFIFSIELLLAEALFCLRFKRRNCFVLRLALSLLSFFAIAYFLPVMENGGILNALLIFFSLFFFSLVILLVIFKETYLTILFCGIAAYALQHITYQLYCLVANLFGLGSAKAVGLYGTTQAFTLDLKTMPAFVLIHAVVYAVGALTLGKRIKEQGEVKPSSVQLFLLLFISVLSLIVLNLFIVNEAEKTYNFVYIVSCNLYGAFCGVFILSLLFALLTNWKLKLENEYVNRIRAYEQKHFKLSKNNIDLINLTCHDMKYQLRLLKERDLGGEEKIKEIEKVLEIFDSKVETENETLNVILTERMLECHTHSIKMNCMVNGKLLSFMSEIDLYTLFGNALDNALEAVLKLSEDKRVINVVTSQSGGMFSVLISNYCKDPPTFVNDLPVSSKSGDGIHGYGLLSIKRIAEKYGGDMRVDYKEGVFNLSLLFALSQDNF